MKEVKTEYYFSKIAVTYIIIFIFVFILVFSFLSYTTYFNPSRSNENKFLGVILFMVMVLFIGLLTRHCVIVIYSIVKNRPALILTQENLTINLNRKTIKWSDIAEISDKYYSGKYAIWQITINLKDSGKNIRIGGGGIKCKKQKLLTTLIEFHQKYGKKSVN